MICSPDISNPEFLDRFNNGAYRQRIPVSGGIDLTAACNLNCEHCYIRTANDRRAEMGTDKVMSLLDQMAAEGCLFLLLTGGEPLLRGDFPEIYMRAKKNGMVVTVFTNGTLVDERITKVFSEYPPWLVEITIYGATAGVHDSITGVAGSFCRTMDGFRRLHDAGIKVDLKTILMKKNIPEFEGMLAMAEGYGVKFRMDAEIFPRFDGDRGPLSMRVSPEEAVEKEMKMSGRKETWAKFIERMSGFRVDRDLLYECSAGETFFHVSAWGGLRPCLMAGDVEVDLNRHSFHDAWVRELPAAFNKRAEGVLKCKECDIRLACDTCPSFFLLENGSKLSYSTYLCGVARQRMSVVKGDRV